MAVPPKKAGAARGADAVSKARDPIADALYNWCLNNHDMGYVFNQESLLDSGIIPNREIEILLSSVRHLVVNKLFKTHDFRGTGTIGWELVSQERAENYQGLTREEHLVFSHIDAASNQGLWTRTLQKRLQAHTKVLDRTYKSLEFKGKIKTMKSVKHPTRKMYIVSGLQPSEDATGGAWFHDGKLDDSLIAGCTMFLEKRISDQSWVQVQPMTIQYEAPGAQPNTKGKGKLKASSIDDDEPRSLSPEVNHREPRIKQKRPAAEFVPYPPGHLGYSTVAGLTNDLNTSGMAKGIRLPTVAVSQLLDVMVYDEKIYKVKRSRRDDELVLDDDDGTVAMFRCYQTPGQLSERYHRDQREAGENSTERRAARRQNELEDLGQGGASEVPCLKCPAFDLCGDGGPVNVVTCPYFDEWFLRTARSDREVEQPWPGSEEFLRVGERKRQLRIDALSLPQQMLTMPKTKKENNENS